MRIFISGGAGFIGSHLCERLLNEGHAVTAYDNLLLGKEEFLTPFQENPQFKFVKASLLDLTRLNRELPGHDLVFHLAANSDISHGAKVTDVDLKVGTFATYNMLEAMRLAGVKQLIFASTSAIYGEAEIRPTPENYGPLLPISFYGASKLACEALCSAFSHNYGIQTWIYRFANIVGARPTHGAIFDFVNKLKKDSKKLEVLGNGTQKKSYLHVSDCVEGMLFGYRNSKDPFQVYNLAGEGVTSVKFLAEGVVQEMKCQAQIGFEQSDRGWRGDVPFTWIDGSKLQKLGWKASLNSDEAAMKAIHEIVRELA